MDLLSGLNPKINDRKKLELLLNLMENSKALEQKFDHFKEYRKGGRRRT